MNNNWYTISELADGLYGISEPKHFEEVNSFLLVGQDEAILIDTGMGFFSMRSVVQKITDLPCRVLNTHSHFDHVGSNSEFSDVRMFDHILNRAAAAEGFKHDFLAQWYSDDQFFYNRPAGLPQNYNIASFPYATYFNIGDMVGNSTFNLMAIHTPGHSDDSVCFWDADRGWLFTGDLLYEGPIFIEKDGGLEKYRNSISRIDALDGVNAMFTSHNCLKFSTERFDSLKKVLTSYKDYDLKHELIIIDRLKLVPE